MKNRLFVSLLIGAMGYAHSPLMAKEIELPSINVIDRQEGGASSIPGAIDIISPEEMEMIQPASLQDALKTVPGVNARDEEGYGAIPNIGIRGLSPNRSTKVLILEDGAPIQPSLFLSNASYYSPPVERISSIEVLKGATGLRYGPNTIGGVINYQSKTPLKDGIVKGKLGSHGYRLLELEAGTSSEQKSMGGGINLITSEANGFRNNGYRMNDILVKGGMAIGQSQWLGLKLTRYENEINTSYVGLRPDEFIHTPTKNPAPDDQFLSNRTSFDINHELEIDTSTKLKTLMYWSQLERNFWRRDVASKTRQGTSFVDCGGTAYCVTGRNRNFDMLGIDSRLFTNYQAFGIQNESEIGVRLHSETMSNKTERSNAGPRARTGVITGNENNDAKAVALYLQNRFLFTDQFAVTPGVRVESYRQNRKNEMNGVQGQANNTELVPGIGATWQLAPELQLYSSVYKGFAPAMISAAISGDGVDQKLDAERSMNIEFGFRGQAQKWTYEGAAFRMDFSNQIVNQALSGGISKTNGGQSLHQGAEGALGYAITSAWSVLANATYIPVAEFKGGTLGPIGNRIPYTPKLTGNLGLNYSKDGLKSFLNAYHVSSQYADSANTVQESNDGTKGLIPSFTTLNWSVVYSPKRDIKLFGVVRNLFDKKFISGRSPDGIFPGAERNFELGLAYQFY
ncbi:MAG: TonB-dependent receptor [Burkholderiales bacterium]|nr:TonB-dependent receptor [Burkholderiales bacterium]